MMPEVLIVSFIMLNEIKLKLCGLYFQAEDELENINEAINRFKMKGDEELIKQNKQELANMCLSRYFATVEEQHNQEEQYHDYLREEIQKKLEEEKVEDQKV